MTEQATMVTLNIDGHEITVPHGTSIWDAARTAGVEIPTLCHSSRLRPVGVCRMCVVDVGERILAASCARVCEQGMAVLTNTQEIESHRRMLTSLLLADYPKISAREESTADDDLLALARRYGFNSSPLSSMQDTPSTPDNSSPVILVDHSACILCDRCVRACDELQHNHILGRTGKGHQTRIAFDLDQPMGESQCVACGECAAVCPTGALTDKMLARFRVESLEPDTA